MGKDNNISMPGVFGGLMRYNEEFDSKIKISPMHVILFAILLALGVLALEMFFPLA